jgi:hypothetical protein
MGAIMPTADAIVWVLESAAATAAVEAARQTLAMTDEQAISFLFWDISDPELTGASI